MSDISSVAMAHGALGVYVDPSGAPVVVVPPEQASRTAAEMAPPGMSVRIQRTDLTAAAKKSIHDDLMAMSSTATASYGFYFDPITATEVIQTMGSGQEFAEIAAKYPGHVEIQAGAAGGLTSDRMSDSSPFWGGARISSPGLCTTGFAAVSKKNSSFKYLNTAGHCFPQGTKVYASGQYIGYISSRQYPTWEIEWIYGSTYAARIYNGTVTSSGFPGGTRVANDTASIPVYGRKSAWVGQSGYCATGWRDGRICDWQVASTDASFINVQILPPKVTATDNLYAYTGTKLLEGNSGGPVCYPYNGGAGALIAGTIVGYFDKGLGNTNYSTKAAESLAHWNLEVLCAGTCVIQP